MPIDLEQHYQIYSIRQHGKTREIQAPDTELKKYQRELVSIFGDWWTFHSSCQARKNHSIITNAMPHMGAAQILHIDIKSCFENTTQLMVEQAINYGQGLRNEITAKEFIELLPYCFMPGLEGLPTGAPTSPILCNIVLTRLDYILAERAKVYSAVYTRYLDDLHFSFSARGYHPALIPKVAEDLLMLGYRMNPKKTKWIYPGQQATVITGIDVTSEHRVPLKFRRMLRAKIQNLAKSHSPLDPETQGCLSYVQSIDKKYYEQMLQYYQRRLHYDETR